MGPTLVENDTLSDTDEDTAKETADERVEVPARYAVDGTNTTIVFDDKVTSSPVGERKPRRQVTVDTSVIPEIVPPHSSQRHRTLVLCFDGTGDQFDADNSNIVKFFSLLKKDDKSHQCVYYQAGIGTYTSPKIVTPLMSKMSLVPWDLDAHVMGIYEFLMQNYSAGDSISIFGFSRGAYTARSLAGMLHKVGLLPAGNFQQVPFAYKMYTNVDEDGWRQSKAFKKAFCRDVSIDFIGVWDTVDSVGIIPKRLPFTISNTIVRTFRQALSLDEHRAKFQPNSWHRPTKHDQDIDAKHSSYSNSRSSLSDSAVLNKMEAEYATAAKATDVKEVWFAGCHCDVGGGSVSNDTPHSLARISLRWMIRECFKAHTGIMFHSERLPEVGLEPATLWPSVIERPPAQDTSQLKWHERPKRSLLQRLFSFGKGELVKGTEEIEERQDSLSPVYDQLYICKWWWLLEIIPFTSRYQNKLDEWVKRRRPNFGRAREILQTDEAFFVHRSVRMRMNARGPGGEKYIPRPKFHVPFDNVQWVD
ncbi:hypothetical protein FISHEDRAFT_46794 [Fistulina hepatica ATCC 64428]|uniref:T6SS Phospholipase effector Tle1-like catalytic domain-containing protein n=1 Tax=Fistulina hepatica ATCC 64428 TaxID=1128425 RepID=A0A0D7A7A8_9AGAR|nr:hypothetical protein FISHEDRAFT_46794 [Fistulina hepatica ATCC 64428]